MHKSKIGLHKWAIAIYFMSTNLKGVSSMKLHRELGISQKSAWGMAQKIRQGWDRSRNKIAGPVEVDEAYFGGKGVQQTRIQKVSCWTWRSLQGSGCGHQVP